ncbi:hypothetical protein EGI05_08135 [Chryseobacterium daecheongense]|uniref:Uncharacterized protein n=1 Tax=Chryseobacterium daecheongense TaxID=192389 RepID=A0A3N0W723_9FLAO|nr:hypothetical protein EGI05_08135 [Chryseobacterium daecheongense]
MKRNYLLFQSFFVAILQIWMALASERLNTSVGKEKLNSFAVSNSKCLQKFKSNDTVRMNIGQLLLI